MDEDAGRDVKREEEADGVGGRSGDDIEKGSKRITTFIFIMNGARREKKREYFKPATLQSRGRRIHQHRYKTYIVAYYWLVIFKNIKNKYFPEKAIYTVNGTVR